MIFQKFKPFCGSVSYSFIDPDTQYKYSAGTYPELVQKIVGYRTQNKLPPIDQLSAVLDNYLCSLPENEGACKPVRLKRSLMGYIKGGIALLQNMAYDSIVSDERANKRAEVCIKCPHNVFPDKGSFMHWADKLAEASVGDRKSKYHKELGNCEVCSCNMRAKVFYGGKIDLPEDQVKALPDFCWQKKGD